jgi:citrate lyase beta subunit
MKTEPSNWRTHHSLSATFARSLIAWICGLVLAAHAADFQPVTRIYLAPDDHTDYMWALDEEGYRKAFGYSPEIQASSKGR